MYLYKTVKNVSTLSKTFCNEYVSRTLQYCKQELATNFTNWHEFKNEF